mmetsp:Transcript_16511/g.18222  ORF Transcript_16511/g.18222 Transcript_16511/m.18222 type:complete len:252 (+) Transcript_16511:42-797(+)
MVTMVAANEDILTVVDEGITDAEKSNSQSSTIPDASTWDQLTQTYRLVYAEYYATSEGANELIELKKNSNKGDFIIPYEMKFSPGKGRGVFSKGFVRKGQTLVQGEDRTVDFEEEKDWRKFLSLLPSALARDVVSWAYVQEDDEQVQEGDPDPKYVVSLDLYAASLMNHGDTTTSPSEHGADVPTSSSSSSSSLANIREHNCSLYAARDIEPGEELMIDYTSFHIKDHDLIWFDQIRSQLFTEEFGFDVLS